jgi:RNA polymerase sigma-70 factor (ECF subfamily)
MREALVLRYAQELRYDEMAAILRIGESTLRSRVHHGLRLLRDLLEEHR